MTRFMDSVAHLLTALALLVIWLAIMSPVVLVTHCTFGVP